MLKNNVLKFPAKTCKSNNQQDLLIKKFVLAHNNSDREALKEAIARMLDYYYLNLADQE